MRPLDLPSLLREGTLDARSVALLWLLADDGVPLVFAGPAEAPFRAGVAAAVLGLVQSRAWVLIDADEEPLTSARLAALLRGDVALGVSLSAPDLGAVMESLGGMGLPEDAVRRLGAILVLDETERGLRCTSVHYLRPSERDAQGHVQRRPPAVLSAWDGEIDAHEDYAWAITPELADRVDRSQADLEQRQASRTSFLATLPLQGAGSPLSERVRGHLATEPERVPAPEHERARPSPFRSGLLDPDEHAH
jgi:hypothetical protein